MSGVYFISIVDFNTGVTVFTGSFVVDFDQTPNIIAFYEDGNPNNILAPPGSWAGDTTAGTSIVSDNIFVSKAYPFTYFGTNITTMSYYAGNYGKNITPPGDGTYNFFSNTTDPYTNLTIQGIANFDEFYLFNITGGPVYPPFPLDQSIPPPCFYTIQGLPMFLNQNVQYKVYYTDIPQFPYLTYFAKSVYSITGSTIYKFEDVPLAPPLSNMNQSQLLTYQQQLQLFRKVYAYNSNAYITYVSNPTAKGPIYYTFQTYKELTNYKAGLQLVNRLYPFDAMAAAYDLNNGVPLRWIVPFPM